MNLKKIGKVFKSKFVWPGPSPYKKRIYRAVVSQRLRNTDLDNKRFCTAAFIDISQAFGKVWHTGLH
jgi:hypothetical protein